ncbi:trypsin-1-like [Ixodes scapularis]|uniref:trypsin-1-like n=1 Tax=Ixodes scapularis TaxID=6945 RepID=UPI001C388EDD|nr:trypsin-1-like [Ixodes scapularis]
MRTITFLGHGLGGRKPDFLRAVVVPVKNNRECYGREIPFSPSAMFCAGAPGRDSCTDDSGGAAMQHEEGHTVQVGIVSFGQVCAQDHGYYTRVSNYINWIEQFIGSLQYADV